MSGLKPICTCWPMASLLQPPPPSLSLLLLFLSTSLTRLEWVQMCDPQTLPLWSPYWSHRAQQRLAHSSEELLAEVSPHSHIICRAIVRWVIEVLQLNAGRHFITQSDLMGCNLTAHIARIKHTGKSCCGTRKRQTRRMNFNKIVYKNVDVIGRKNMDYAAFPLKFPLLKVSDG